MPLTPFLFRPVLALLVLCLGVSVQAQAQSPVETTPPGLRFADYLDAVERYSPQLGAEQQNLVSAQAGIGIAGLRPDPTLTLGASREQVRTGQPRPATRSYEVSLELETGGKRGARIQAARSQLRLAEVGVEGLRSQLFSEAARDFTQACRDSRALARKQQTLKALGDVVQANEVRRRAGDIGGVELLQSRVERDRFQAEVAQARAEAQTSRLALSIPLGRRLAEVLAAAGPGGDALQCDFQAGGADAPVEDAEALVARALQARSDVRLAQAALDHARDSAGVVQANRWVNPSVALGLSAVPATGASGAGQEASGRSRTLSVSVSVPLPLSRLNRGDLLQAEAAVTQAMLGLQQAQSRAEAEVRSARLRFLAAQENLERYREGVLRDAQRVLDGLRLSYRQGQASLLELLSAQRSADEAWLGALEAETDLAKATVELQLGLGQRPAL